MNWSPVNISSLESSLSALRSRYQQGLGQRDLLQVQLSQKQGDLSTARTDIELWRQVQVLLGKASEFAREQLKARIEQTVSAALQAVFADSTMRFEIEMSTLGGKPAADWRVVSCYGATGGSDALTVTASPEDAKGGGVTDVVSLALRLALLELTRPKPGGPVLLDEVGKHVSSEYVANVAEFLRQYARRTGRQVILITHQRALMEVADVGYQVAQRDGISEVSRSV